MPRDVICSVIGCERLAKARGWCGTHYERWRKTGDLTCGKRKYPVDAVCAVDGCEKPRKGREWCATHYARWQSNGDPLVVQRVKTGRRITAQGYVAMWEPAHPLATAHGYVLEHRKVMHDAGYDVIGMHVHHLDHDRTNNDLSNLVVMTEQEHLAHHGGLPTRNQAGTWKPKRGRVCVIDGCDKPVDSRDWCSAHYTRWLRHGDPLGGRRSPRN